jgi:hypothetical protein
MLWSPEDLRPVSTLLPLLGLQSKRKLEEYFENNMQGYLECGYYFERQTDIIFFLYVENMCFVLQGKVIGDKV